MLSLTRIFLHNWHRFHHHLIDVEDSLYLAGHNGSGKSSVLDALQVVLVADLQKIRFNSSAQERSARDLDSYVRGRIGEHHYLRPGNTVAYVALEFTDEQNTSNHLALGACIEASATRPAERSYFILSEKLAPEMFVPGGRPLPRRELKQLLGRGRRGARVFTQVGEYRDEMLNRLGGLNERFFDLFLRALTFQPIRDIRQFVEQWLLEEQPLEVETLKRVVERLTQLRLTTEQVEAQTVALQAIVDRQFEVLRLRQRHAEYILLAARLQRVAAEKRVAELERRQARLKDRIAAGMAELAGLQASLKGSREALREAEVRLHSSDVVRRRDELQKQIQDASREASVIVERRAALWRELRREAHALRSMLETSFFETAEVASLSALVNVVSTLDDNAPPPDSLGGLLAAALPALDRAHESAREAEFRLRQESETLRERAAVLKRELEALRQSGRPSYPEQVERFRDLLAPVIGERPLLLCELLEIPDERWQNAIEATLGQRRFNVVVLPEQFEAALEALDHARGREHLYDVGLLDLARAQREGHSAREGSLALQVATDFRLLRAYLDHVLGDIITCESVAELRRHRRAVTPTVVLYSEWTARAIPPARYQPWFIGERARSSQIAAREREMDEVNSRLQTLTPALARAASRVTALKGSRDALLSLNQRLDAPLDERGWLEEISECEAELKTLDASGVAALGVEVERLKHLVAGEEEAKDNLTAQVGGWRIEAEQLARERQTAQRDFEGREFQWRELCAQHSEAVVNASAEMLAQRLAQFDGATQDARGLTQSAQDVASPPALNDIIRNTETAARNFSTRAANEGERLLQEATAYNLRFQFAAAAGNAEETRYGDELQRLAATELPRYKEQVAAAQREAEEELREHVLHKLREQITGARLQLERINDALDRLEFRGERYRFRSQPAEESRDFYDLIIEAPQHLGGSSLYESKFYEDHRATFDRFYEILIRAPRSDMEQAERERLVDYRRYLDYDIEVTHPDGRTSRLSKIVNQTSGGETQTPFYLTIAASFVQLYRIGERTGRPTIRLVVFDEAFSKMDQDRIGATLELFQDFDLQIVTATPLERCEYLVPKICTSLVLTSVGDHVLVEPYRNYESRLEAFRARRTSAEGANVAEASALDHVAELSSGSV
jgi:uncharacterized protein YPO0396